ncbi:MAG: hypothetical protein Q8S75_05050 [Nitrospirota bacterium]|nr:hypothetical protein [Nitrospirota bacterium]
MHLFTHDRPYDTLFIQIPRHACSYDEIERLRRQVTACHPQLTMSWSMTFTYRKHSIQVFAISWTEHDLTPHHVILTRLRSILNAIPHTELTLQQYSDYTRYIQNRNIQYLHTLMSLDEYRLMKQFHRWARRHNLRGAALSYFLRALAAQAYRGRAVTENDLTHQRCFQYLGRFTKSAGRWLPALLRFQHTRAIHFAHQ